MDPRGTAHGEQWRWRVGPAPHCSRSISVTTRCQPAQQSRYRWCEEPFLKWISGQGKRVCDKNTGEKVKDESTLLLLCSLTM